MGTSQSAAAAAAVGAAHERASHDPKVDAAYGAYQRGLYLTALADASQRAQQGDPAAMTLLGELYAHGSGIGRDDEKAKQWYQAAAERGDRDAMFALAMFNFAGRGGPRNEQEGKRFLSEAAKLGHMGAAYDLGLLYMQGQMFPQDVAARGRIVPRRGRCRQSGRAIRAWHHVQARQWRAERLDQSGRFDAPGFGRRQCRGHGRIGHRAIQRRRRAEERSGRRPVVFESRAPRQPRRAGSFGARADGGPRHGVRSTEAIKWHLIAKASGDSDPDSMLSPPSRARKCAPRRKRKHSFGSRPPAWRRWRRASACPQPPPWPAPPSKQ